MAKTRYEISPDHKSATCRHCPATIYFVKTKNDKNMPCNADGFSHFETCPNAKDFSGQSRKAEASEKAASGEVQDELDKVLTMFDDHVKLTDERHEKLRAYTSKLEDRFKKIDERFSKMSDWAQQLEDRLKLLEATP